MKRNEIAAAIQSNRLDEVLRASAVLTKDPNMIIPVRDVWNVTPLFLAVDHECQTAEEREQNFAIVSYLLTIPNIKASIKRKEDDFSCLAAAVYNAKVAVISKLLTHLRYVEFKGNRAAFLDELNQITQQAGGTTALHWAIVRHQPSIARLLLAVDPDNILITERDVTEAERREAQLDYLAYDLKQIREEQTVHRAERNELLARYTQFKQQFEQHNQWSEGASQLLAFATGALSIAGVFFPSLPIEPAQVVIAAFVSLIIWYFSGVKRQAESGRNRVVQTLISDKGFFDEPSEIDSAVENMSTQAQA